MSHIKALDGATANSNSDTFTWLGGKGRIYASGTFDTCTISLQFSPDEGTTFVACDTSNLDFTAAGHAEIDYPRCLMRVNLSSVGASTEVDADVIGPCASGNVI